MRSVLAVAADLVREALSRKWFLGLGLLLTAVLVAISFGLSLEVVDGALAATKLFGGDLSTDIVPADVALRPVFRAAAYVIFYGGLTFGIIACADFAPGLLSPGRIEHLLSLPLGRSALIGGTYLGVVGIVGAAALYGALGFTAILGVKTGVWTPGLLEASGLAVITFGSIYGLMITSAVFVRSSAVSSMAGGTLFVAGIVAGYRDDVALMFERGLGRQIFEAATVFIPPISAIADEAGHIAGSLPFDPPLLARRLAGMVLFGLAAFAVGVWRFEQRDF